MSGHSKWSNIKRKKGINDLAKAVTFAKLSRIVTLSVIEGGGMTDPDVNVRLRLAIEKARQENMPKENIMRAIERGGGPDKALLKEVRYEAFGPNGVSLLILAATDNPNRTITQVRNALEQNGGKQGNQGSVGYLFTQCGTVFFEKSANNEDDILQFAEKINALDIEVDDAGTTVYIPFEAMGKVKAALGGLVASAPELEFRPSLSVDVHGESQLTLIGLIEKLESLDDVQDVYSNAVFLDTV